MRSTLYTLRFIFLFRVVYFPKGLTVWEKEQYIFSFEQACHLSSLPPGLSLSCLRKAAQTGKVMPGIWPVTLSTRHYLIYSIIPSLYSLCCSCIMSNGCNARLMWIQPCYSSFLRDLRPIWPASNCFYRGLAHPLPQLGMLTVSRLASGNTFNHSCLSVSRLICIILWDSFGVRVKQI